MTNFNHLPHGHGYTQLDLKNLRDDPIPTTTELVKLTTWEEICSYDANCEVVLAETEFWWGRIEDCDVYVTATHNSNIPDPADHPPGTTEVNATVDACVFLKDQIPDDFTPIYPSSPRGSTLMKMPLSRFLLGSSDGCKRGAFGKHGWQTLLAAYHGNPTVKGGRPWSFPSWTHYNILIDRFLTSWMDVKDIPGPPGLT